MAPALVEHSAAKERNSISKEYSKIRGCISQFDIDLLDKYSHQYPADSFETKVKGSSLLEMNNSEKKERQKISFANSESMVSLKEVPVISLPKLKNIGSSCDVVKAGYKNGTLNYKLEKVPSSDNSAHVYSTKIESTKQDCNKSEDRLPEPVATMDNSSIINYIQNKKESCGLKFFDLNRNMNKLNARLRQLQTKNITSHVSAHVNNKLDSYDLKPSKSNDTKSKKEISSNAGIQLQKSWEDLKKVHDMVSFKTDDTDCEDDLEVRHRVPVSRSKKKSDNPPPPPDVLHQWKIKRAYIGSQCSWLSLKISSLDKKISELDDLLQKHKLERKNSKTDVNLDKSNQSVLDTSEEKGELTHAPEEQICRRVLPYTTHHRHEYVSSLESNSQSYNCRCLPSVASCRLCLHSQKHSINDTRNERTGKMDWSFHPMLSYENDVSLSFLLEETLRRQRINTKVTISKPTKKKKKQKIKECAGNNELSEKDPTGNKHSTSSKLTSDKNHVRCKGGKGDRLKYDEVPRKRSTGIESGHSGRSRKQRKLSESEESWKPSTPTELNSPFSQNISSNTFFPIKQRKKNSSGGDYDINNIVIPYSMAAATRVERIQYKEIPTPGWRNVGSAFNGHDVEIEHCELTDDEVYLDRHSRCEVTEKKKFTDYFQPAIRRRPYHLSESTASGPPSPLISDDVVRQNINTPTDSPIINSATTNSRVVNVTLIPEEEREPCWPLRNYPLCPSDCKNLRINNNSSSLASTTSSTNDTISTSPTFSNADSSKYAIPSKYSDSSTTVVSALMDCPRGTITPSYTPTQTPMPSPLCSPGGTPSDMDGTENSSSNPDSWTVKVMNEPKLDVITTETQRTGIVLKLAKK